MRNLLLLIAFLFSSFASAQQYLQKQDTPVVNMLINAGFENSKSNWVISVSSTVTVSTTSPIQGAASLVFDSTAASQTVRSDLYTMPSTKKTGSVSECQAEMKYLTEEATNKYLFRVLNASSTVISTVTLEPVSVATVARLFFTCPAQARLETISTGSALPIKLDSNHLGTRKDIIKADITEALAYEPVATVSATSPLTITGGASNPVISLDDSGAVSGSTYTKVQVDAKGRVTYGSTLTESDIPNLQTTKITSGVFGVDRGGTGFSSYGAGDILYATTSSTLTKLPIGVTGQILTADSGFPAWQPPASSTSTLAGSMENFVRNPLFESSPSDNWTTSGVSVVSGSYTYPSFQNISYSQITATASGGYFRSNSISLPTYAASGALVFNADVRAVSSAWIAQISISGTIVASQTIASGSVIRSMNPLYYTGVNNQNGPATYVEFVPSVSDAILQVDNVNYSVANRSVKTSTGNFVERMERVAYGGDTDTTACSASPCTIHRQSGAVASVTRSAAGQYVVNFAAGTFSDKPSCYGSHSNNSNAMFHFLNSRTSTSYQFQSVTDAGGSTDSYGDVICVGPR